MSESRELTNIARHFIFPSSGPFSLHPRSGATSLSQHPSNPLNTITCNPELSSENGLQVLPEPSLTHHCCTRNLSA